MAYNCQCIEPEVAGRGCKLCGGLIQGGVIDCPDCPHLLHRALVCTEPGCDCRWDREFGRRLGEPEVVEVRTGDLCGLWYISGNQHIGNYHCTLPAGHDGDYHQEWRGGDCVASWQALRVGE
jgi:hypothetical protein